MNTKREVNDIRFRAACGAVRVFTASVLACILAACGERAVWTPGQPLAKDKVKVAVIFPNWINDESAYDYMHNQGILEMQRALQLRDEQIIRREDVFIGRHGETEAVMRDCITEGANIVIAISWDFREACEKLAGEFPRVIFANAMGDRGNDTNFTYYAGRMYEAWYLAGVVAGMRTGTGLIGFVAAQGKDNSEVTGAVNAFALGAERANAAAQIQVRAIHSWFDPLGESGAVRALAASGCDVIAAHCDSPYAVKAAEKAGVWAVGYSRDMIAVAPRAVLCSAVFDWGVYYTRLVGSAIDGSFTTEPYRGGLAEGMVDLSLLNGILVKIGTLQAVEAERRRIAEGGFIIFEGPLETNDGRVVGRAGDALSYGEITAAMNWYYRNVTGE